MVARRPPFALPLSALFGAAVKLRRAAHSAGLLPAGGVEGAAVISVGNLRAGGSGKTPFAALLAGRLRDEGLAVSVVLRGFRGAWERAGGLVSTGGDPLVPARLAGDEAWLLARRLPGVRVRVGADRLAAARAEAAAGVRVIVLDDGFQHFALHRDLDLVLACPEDLDPRTRLLPAGPLREPPRAARRADLLAGLARDWEGRPDAPPVLLDPEPVAVVDGAWTAHPLGGLAGARAWLLAGIARPARFADTARRAGFVVAGETFFPDHHRFAPRELDRVAHAARESGAELVLTTEKDLARLDGMPLPPSFRALRIDLRVARGDDILRKSIAEVVEEK
jgi:tetraacyldisaccharide 4'-kinase